MKNKFTFYHLLLINHVVMTLIVLGIIGAYGTYLVNIEQKAARERLDPLMVREAGRIKSDFQSIESNVQKLKSFVEMFEYIPANLRVERFKRFASEALAPYPIQYNAFVALGPRLSRKYFNRNAYVLTIHRNAALEGSEKYLSPDTFIAEEFLSPGYDKDPDVEWWAMNKNRPGLNFSNFYFDKGYMEKVMFTSAMGLYGHDEVEAVVGVDTLTGEMAQRMGAFHLGETGGLFVVDESGRPVWSLVSKDLPLIGFRYEKPATIDQFKKMSSLSGKVFNFTQEHIQDFTGEDGDTYITFSKPVQIKGRSWHLVAYQKKSEAFGALYGRIFFFLISVFVAYLAGSIMLYLTGRYVIRREKRAFEELRKSRDVAEAATKAKSVFLSTMSHEIRTPLNSLLGSADLLMETKLNQEQHEYVNSMMNAGESLLSVVNNVLDFSKIEAGKMSLDLKEFS
ncbi:MAG TPA: histidine kinase dimerization/phospho-acceptor domain-containing protein, partial [Bdellovibrio sp.]|nr:histidine kinase dimerization/phospho-acceptor domain-containing protein [Bdellovibrio sp.]